MSDGESDATRYNTTPQEVAAYVTCVVVYLLRLLYITFAAMPMLLSYDYCCFAAGTCHAVAASFCSLFTLLIRITRHVSLLRYTRCCYCYAVAAATAPYAAMLIITPPCHDHSAPLRHNTIAMPLR